MASAPIILVPGFWLGAWAWDEVAALLRADGHEVTALTLPGLESKEADRSSISFQDHVDAIIRALEAAGRPAVLAVHSASGFSGYAASDQVPERICSVSSLGVATSIAVSRTMSLFRARYGFGPCVWAACFHARLVSTIGG